MFIAKQNLIEAFKQIHLLYSNISEELTKQGCTQFFSGLRYFLAASAFEKRQARAWIDSTNLNDKNVFVDYVGEVVAINDSEYTCNFYNDFKVDEKDYKVGSNFYSAGFVDDSRKNPTVVYEYPSRDKSNIILKAQNGKIGIADAGVSAFTRKYLEKTQYKKALILWLLRNENIKSLTKECVESVLLNRYTESVAKALFVSDYSFLTSVNLVAEKAVLKSDELSLVEREIEREEPNTSSPRQQNSSSFTPAQLIYYGVPGCGKSHKITTMLKDEKAKDPTFSEENQVFRTTFHPEYTNADFIGQILPEVHENGQGTSVVEYKFKPGPFAKILKQALHNPSKPFYLVIEEINRGNAAAIFGDVFQLLDRLKNGDTSRERIGTDGFENHYGKGWSEYFIMNADVNAFIRDANSENELDTKSIDVSGIHFSSSTGIRLPPNLSIYATMNTSDQNVFTLDNAFLRRWDMELVPNTCKWDDGDHKNQAQLPIGDTDIRWETFRKTVNNEISGGDFFNADDKQLGLFFIDADGDKIDEKKFANKVLKYLWADVFKRDTGKIFKSENLSKVVEDFTGTDAFDKVFVEDFVQSLKNTNDEIKNHE